MKHSIFKAPLCAIAAAVMFAAVCGQAQAGAIDDIKDNGVLRVGVKNDVIGFSLQDPLTGEYTGYEDTLAEMIAKELGVDIEFTSVTAATRSELIDSGDLDLVLATFTITPERVKNWDFSTPYYTDYVSVLVEDKSGIARLSDLVGKTVGVSSGSTSAQKLVEAMVADGIISESAYNPDNFDPATWSEQIKFHQYDNYPTISTALSAGEVAAFCVDKSILNIYKTKGRSFIAEEFAPQEYGAVTKKGSDLSPYVDGLIKKWLEDGTIAQLLKDNNLE